LIPVYGEKQRNAGNQKKNSAAKINEAHNRRDATVDFVAKHMENDGGADCDINQNEN